MKPTTKSQHGDDRCYCGHARANHNIEGMCPLSAIAYQYARFPGDDYCKCEGFIVAQPPAPRAGERDEWRLEYYKRGTSEPWLFCVTLPSGAIIARTINEHDAKQIITEHNQHATLVEQRGRLLKLLRKSRLILMGAITYSDAEHLRLTETIDEIESTITTIEQEGEASR